MYRIRFDPDAESDLASLQDYILNMSASPAIANTYVRRIVDHCLALAEFPMRGTARDDIRAGLRTIGFERRATIAFLIEGESVTALRVLYGGRDLGALARDRR